MKNEQDTGKLLGPPGPQVEAELMPRLKKCMAVFLISAMVGCSTSWVKQAEDIIAVLLPAVANVLVLVAAFQNKGVSAADMAILQKGSDEAKADLELAKSLIEQYNAANSALKPALVDKINAALQSAKDHEGAILAALHITDTALVAKIQAVVGLVLDEIAAVERVIPVAQGKVSAKKAGPPPLKAKAFKAAYNSTMTSPSGSADVDQAAAAATIK